MSVGKASIARAVNAEKTAKTEEKVTEVKEAQVKAAEVKAETEEKAAEKTTVKKTAAKAPAKKTAAKTTARKAATTKTTAKKTTTRKTTTRKTAAKKTAAAETTTGTVAQNVIIPPGILDLLQAFPQDKFSLPFRKKLIFHGTHQRRRRNQIQILILRMHDKIAEIRLMTNGIVEIFFPGSHLQNFFFIKK